MCLQALWSFWLACAYHFALRYKKDLQTPILVSLFVGGDTLLPFPYKRDINVISSSCMFISRSCSFIR
ncbi:unnamed protein product [Eruca vesicaria subsp. sativa]|uniref:Secreted protein n=1 Tax=Eruca vesicaria subsp. sativa TaxID=29727 RepID=A0ABC8LGX6_ERUVS|nr:unnamed protein product [Eruca vesicaria subsp. sativa]